MPADARLGDPHSHGGTIVEGSPNVMANGKPTARKGDKAICPIHGLQTIANGSSVVFVNGKARARVGDLITCGAVITAGSHNIIVN